MPNRFLAFLSRLRPNRRYRAYTTAFDREVPAHHLDSVLGPQSERDRAAQEEARTYLESEFLAWRLKLQVASADLSEPVRARLSAAERNRTVVTLLIDQSGSMKGQKMLFAAFAADVAQDFLSNLGISFEILGFTTSEWKGGRSRQVWETHFRPSNPGRLNDLLHIIYKGAGSHGASLPSMLRPELPKENIDGEAIIWAATRLRALPHSRKLLIVLSDGAPVDDSTLLENGSDYLLDHLRSVIAEIVSAGDLELGAMGLSHRVDDLYPMSEYVEAPKDLAPALVAFLARMLLNDTTRPT